MPMTDTDLRLLDAYWRAANYLSVGQIYLLDNPLLREPLRPEHVKPRLLGHWGTTPGLNFLYVHLNRAIRERELDAIFVTRRDCSASSGSSPSPVGSPVMRLPRPRDRFTKAASSATRSRTRTERPSTT